MTVSEASSSVSGMAQASGARPAAGLAPSRQANRATSHTGVKRLRVTRGRQKNTLGKPWSMSFPSCPRPFPVAAPFYLTAGNKERCLAQAGGSTIRWTGSACRCSRRPDSACVSNDPFYLYYP